MDFTGRIVLSFIEEDNTQRAYFRIRPLLMQDGPLSKEDIDQLPDEGYLRIVPDKNEQHTFKDRMRELGCVCVLDLFNIPPEAVKIRNNKNYSPQRGENNQFIVYSDAVQAVPQNLFYEVISAEAGDKEKIARSCTPLCYVRDGGKIYGPVSRSTGLDQEGAAPLPPDSEGIYSITMPDGAQRLFYWPRSEAKSAAQQKDAKEHADEYTNRKLSGVPLYQTVAKRQNTQQRAHNPLIEAVDQQMRAGRIEAPGAVLSQGAALKQVENPMDAFKHALSALWPLPEMQRQAVAQMLSMTGVQHILNQQLAGRGVDAVTEAMNSQIQDLEAERLSLIMQLEQARKNVQSLKKEVLEQASREEKEALERVHQEADKARADLENVNAAWAKLLSERDEIVAQMQCGDALQLAAPMGGHADLNTLCERVCACMKAQNLACTWDDAVHLLTLLCLCEGQMEIKCDTPADARSAAQALAVALGARSVYNGNDCDVRLQQGGDGCCFEITHVSVRKTADHTRLLVDLGDEDTDYDREANYVAAPWPIAYMKAQEGWAFDAMPAYPPVKANVLHDALLRLKAEPPRAALKLIDDMNRELKAAGAPLPQSVRKGMYQYLSAAAVHMEGGAAKAMDYAVSAWVVPHVRKNTQALAQVKALCGGLPRTMALLER